MYRKYVETGDGWRLTASRRGSSNARYRVEPTPKQAKGNEAICGRYAISRLIAAIDRARTAMGEN